MFLVAISGPPGAGKGTQSKLLVQEFGFEYISTGEALRREMAMSTEVGKQIKMLMDQGNLVSDEIVTDIVRDVVKESIEKNARGILFDGYPRTVPQAMLLDEIIEENNIDFIGMIGLEVDENVLINRILLRGKTSGRNDDNEESVKRRLDEYYEKTEPVLDYCKLNGKYFGVDGEGEVDEIHQSINDIIKTYI
ncbi:adenylate kinase [Odoribacter sp. OttesenSCG-928-L07]|nr:adenylate kinase [Odoribacter sp. OttesenSCG-928-L07]MDL2239698.1 adenylate kinase [Bacteroidales bacterium OttesenSCG-928-L14]MDL2240811.1 adenylate kinase [Bacteroidales bacterium OttesenSCG-928-K22]